MSIMGEKKDQIMKENRALALFQNYGGFVYGHTEFKDGSHSSGYIEKMNVLKQPRVLGEIAQDLASLFADTEIDVVCGPVHVGAILGYSVAWHLNVPFTLTYIEVRTGETFFHRAFHPKGKKLLFVDDFIASGENIRRNSQFFEEENVTCMGVAVIGVSRNITKFQVPVRSLFQSPFEKVSAENCLQCLENTPLVHQNVRE